MPRAGKQELGRKRQELEPPAPIIVNGVAGSHSEKNARESLVFASWHFGASLRGLGLGFLAGLAMDRGVLALSRRINNLRIFCLFALFYLSISLGSERVIVIGPTRHMRIGGFSWPLPSVFFFPWRLLP